MEPSISHFSRAFLLVALLIGLPLGAGRIVGQEQGEPEANRQEVQRQTVPDLFASDVPLQFTLVADFDALGRDRSQESEERPALVYVNGYHGDRVGIPVEVKTRGTFRLQERICSDPPLRLDFPKSTTYGTVFDGQDKLKLVTHCQDTEEFQENVREEYLAYRIYNLLTDVSFRVQLAEITYLDTSGRNDPETRIGFLLEDEDAMATRLGGSLTEPTGLLPNQFVMDQIGLMYIFQYMVGNVDWATGASHNVRVLTKGEEYFPIPYDFDWTGLVNAPYAAPNRLTQEYHDTVRERVYWGICMPGIDYTGLFARFNEQRDAVLALAEGGVGLSKPDAESAVQYLTEFFDIINDPSRAQAEIIGACRPWL
jgi:hypothetical protein